MVILVREGKNVGPWKATGRLRHLPSDIEVFSIRQVAPVQLLVSRSVIQ